MFSAEKYGVRGPVRGGGEGGGQWWAGMFSVEKYGVRGEGGSKR